MVQRVSEKTVQRLMAAVAAALLLLPGAVSGAGGDWNIYMNASTVNRISADGDSLWCATDGGILLFDLADSTFTQYIDGLGFKTNRVTDVTVDQSGDIWAGFATSGIVRIENPGADPFVKHYSSYIDGIVSDSITCLAPAGDEIFYGTRNGAAKFINRLPTRVILLTDSLENVHVYDMLIMGDTLLWVASERGVSRYDRTNDSYLLYDTGRAVSLCEFDGDLYCAGENGVLVFDGSDWSGVIDSLHGRVPFAVASGGGSLVCITTQRLYTWNGFSFVSTEAGELFNLLSSLYRFPWGGDVLVSVAVDRNGTPWVGCEYAQQVRGAYVTGFAGGNWINKALDLISQNDVVELDLAPDGGIWTSSRYYGVSYMSPAGEWTSYTKYRGEYPGNGLSYFGNNLVLLHDTQGYLWCHSLNYDLDRITLGNILSKDDDVWRRYTQGDGTITVNTFLKAREDPAGNRWFLADGQEVGINIVSADTTEWISIDPGTSPLASGKVTDCVFGNFGVVYLALPGHGVQRWNTRGFLWSILKSTVGDTWETLFQTTKDMLAIESNDTVVWVGTSSGLLRYENGSLDSITVKITAIDVGLVHAIVNDVEYDGNGFLWIATDGGVEKLDGEGNVLKTYTSAAYWSDKLSKLGYPSSVISPLTSNLCKALAYDADKNVMWIGTTNGVAMLDLDPPPVDRIPLSTAILYPNPVHISRGDDALRISRISEPVSVKVLTIEGELVHEDREVAEGDVAWDLLTLNGFKARSGVYIVLISSGTATEIRKVAIIK